MHLTGAFVTAIALLVSHRCSAAPTESSDETPPDFPGAETPYRVVPTGTDAGALNKVGTYLYGYNGCKKYFGSGAKGKIDDAYYDAWLISK